MCINIKVHKLIKKVALKMKVNRYVAVNNNPKNRE